MWDELNESEDSGGSGASGSAEDIERLNRLRELERRNRERANEKRDQSRKIERRNREIRDLSEKFPVLSQKKDPYASTERKPGEQAGSALNAHPVLGKSPRFSGSPNTDANPLVNPQAKEEHDARNAPELAARPGMALSNRKKPRPTYTPLPTRPGG